MTGRSLTNGKSIVHHTKKGLTLVRPRGYWQDINTQREYLDRLALILNIKRWEDWYQVKKSDVENNGGRQFLDYFGKSHIKAIMQSYPQHPWDLWKFSRLPSGFWIDKSNQREFLDLLYVKLNFKSWEDWYGTRRKTFEDNHADALIHLYGGSHIKMLTTLYPDRDWKLWKFQTGPRNYWTSTSNINDAMNWLSKELKIQKLEDWHSLASVGIIKKYFGTTILRYANGMQGLLQLVFPKFRWQYDQISRVGKSQKILHSMIRNEVYENDQDIHYNFKHPELKWSTSNLPMELDVYIPSERIAFEYQGKHHYEEDPFHRALKISNRDSEKLETCRRNGITLVLIPYWWDLKKESLMSTIQQYRNNL